MGDSLGQRLRGRRLVPLPATSVGHPNPRSIAHELDRAAARRVDDWQAAGHRLENHCWTRIVYLRMEEQVSPPVEGGRVALRISPDQVHLPPQPELLDQRLSGRDEPSGHEQAGVGM